MADTPTSFFTFIRPPFNLNLSIPTSFLRNLNLNGGRCSKAILRREGHEWPVNITDGSFSGDGWRKCVRENGIQEFDFIVFEHHGNMVFDFLVFDPSTCEKQYPNPCGQMDVEVTKETNYSTINKATPSSSNDHRSYFTSTLKPSSFKKSIMYLPIDFVRSNGLNVEKMILRDDKSRSWEVLVKEMDGRRFYLGYGFRSFLVANELKEGDAFKFELVENENDKPPIVNFSCKSRKRGSFVPKEGSRLCYEDDHPRPYFVSKLKSISFERSILYLPNEFAKKNGLFINGEMILKTGKDERTWIVELTNHKNKYCYIGRGWKDFRVANCLKEGDRFKLQIDDDVGEKLAVNFYVLKNPSRLS